MRVVVQNTLTTRQWVGFDSPAGFTVGREAACDVTLDSRFVSGTHLRVERSDAGWEVELLPGVNPVEINGKQFEAGTRVQIKDQAIIKVMEFVLTFQDTAQEETITAA